MTKRRVIQIVVFLLLGAIVNVAVAWGCLLFEGARPTDSEWVATGVTRIWDHGPAAGLPLRSLEWRKNEIYDSLPVTIIWPGFAINTIFYAAILWLLLFAPGAVRRTVRRRRGLCPACAYPIGASPVCTECGHKLT